MTAMSGGFIKKGALPSQTIVAMMESGFVLGAATDRVQPSSLDLTLADEIYQVAGIFQPRPGETVRAVLKAIKPKKWSYQKALAPNQMYLARLNEKLALPESVYGYCNPKSTSGRLDLHVRLLADGVSRYDAVAPAGWPNLGRGEPGELWVAIMPKSFAVKLAPGLALNQLRFFNLDTRLDELELELAIQRYQLLWRTDGRRLRYGELKIRDNDGSVILTLDLAGQPVGYVGRETKAAIDASLLKHYVARDFFEPLKKTGDYLRLEKGKFYILSTVEAVRVPPELACEMKPMDERSGDFRSHYAGFIDPGWGWGAKGEGKGRPLTLEVRPFEDLIVRHGQPIAKIKFEKMAETPEVIYDALPSNYLVQHGPRLAKQFK